jgi:hypothetical protein
LSSEQPQQASKDFYLARPTFAFEQGQLYFGVVVTDIDTLP